VNREDGELIVVGRQFASGEGNRLSLPDQVGGETFLPSEREGAMFDIDEWVWFQNLNLYKKKITGFR